MKFRNPFANQLLMHAVFSSALLGTSCQSRLLTKVSSGDGASDHSSNPEPAIVVSPTPEPVATIEPSPTPTTEISPTPSPSPSVTVVPGCTALEASFSTWSTVVGGKRAITVECLMPDGARVNVTNDVTWNVSIPHLVVHKLRGGVHSLQAVGVGSGTLTVAKDGLSANVSLTVNPTNIFVQFDTGKIAKYSPAGSQIGSMIVTSQTGNKGMVAIPGGVVSLGNNVKFKHYDNSLGLASSPIPFDGANIIGPQQTIMTADRTRIIAGSWTNSKFYIFSLTSGAEIGTITPGTRATSIVEIPDGSLLIDKTGNTIQKFSPISESSYAYTADLLNDDGPFFYDYCIHQDKFMYMNLPSVREVVQCTLSGVCNAIATGLPTTLLSGALTAHFDKNSTDCAFFVTYESGKIDRYSGDGTLVTPNWRAAGDGQVYNMEFEMPAEE